MFEFVRDICDDFAELVEYLIKLTKIDVNF